MNRAYGIDAGISVTFLPIKTVGKPAMCRYIVWLLQRRRARVNEPFLVPRPNGGNYIIPGGFEFDGGSVPRWLLATMILVCIIFPFPDYLRNTILVGAIVGLLIDSYGLMLYAFAVHDFGVRYGLLITGRGKVEKLETVRDANTVMRKVNFATNNMKLLGWFAHAAVAIGAGMAWRKYRKGRVVPDASWRDFNYGKHCFINHN